MGPALFSSRAADSGGALAFGAGDGAATFGAADGGGDDDSFFAGADGEISDCLPQASNKKRQSPEIDTDPSTFRVDKTIEFKRHLREDRNARVPT